MKEYFSAESVGKGHPDKICDQIADSILDAILKQDPHARCAIEVIACNRLIVIAGELKTKSYVDVVEAAWEIILPLGYNETDFSIVTNINHQSKEITNLVEINEDVLGAGDQGIVVGYASDETPSFMPLETVLAHQLLKELEKIRQEKNPSIKGLKADMKSEVVLSRLNHEIIWEKVVLALQHEETVNLKDLRKEVEEKLIKKVAQANDLNFPHEIYINKAGSFISGGPIADTGLTGRKIIVDAYGLAAHHGGGAFSGKDGTKVDRSGAYLARYVAKNLVAAKLAKKIEIIFVYVIGVERPIAIKVNTFQSSKITTQEFIKIIQEEFDLSVQGTIKNFSLQTPLYKQTSVYGHFGKENLPWEKLDKVAQLKKYFKD